MKVMENKEMASLFLRIVCLEDPPIMVLILLVIIQQPNTYMVFR